MEQIIVDKDGAYIDWAAKRIGVNFRSDAKAIARLQGDQIRAVTVYDNFSPCDCSMHIAADGKPMPWSKTFIEICFEYPFVQCGFKRVTGLVAASNKRALEIDRKFGFVYEGTCRDALPDGDLIVLGMLRNECRFIPKQFRR